MTRRATPDLRCRARWRGRALRIALAVAGCALSALVQPAAVDPAPSAGQGPSLLLQLRPGGGGPAVTNGSATHTEATERERQALLAQGEAALAVTDIESALRSFERAALMRHAAESEIALIRAYMQRGDYRRALAFGAHTAGAHRDVPGAPALYAWLLYLGGQRVAAQRLLDAAPPHTATDPALRFVQTVLQTDAPAATGLPLTPPLRLAPYAAQPPLPAGARTIASATLLDGGEHAVIPGTTLPVGATVWIRNGVGEASRGRVERRLAGAPASLLRLDHPLAMPEHLTMAPRDPFPGSIVYMVEYPAIHDRSPLWPLLRAGFAGRPQDDGAGRALGIELPPGPRGGPVFDAQGRLAGVALPRRHGQDRWLLPSQLSALAPRRSAPGTTAAPAPPMSVDEVYERSLRVSVQVLAVR